MNTLDLSTQTFSNSWYRVYSLRCELRPSVQVNRQIFDSRVWYVMRDGMSSEWFRISEEAYKFVARMSIDRTIEEVWHQTLDRDKNTTLSQEEVIQILAQLHLSNMLVYDQLSETGSFVERFSSKQSKDRLAAVLGFMSIKIPLWDPDRFFNKTLPIIRFIFGPVGLFLYATLLVLGVITFFNNKEVLFSASQGVLELDNLFLLYVGFAVAKSIHELGHGALCKYFGGEVHIIGVMLILFTPIPYCDASSSWGFKHRSERLLVAGAGMGVELGVATIALLIWSATAPGTLNSLCYNIIFTASISTILFNANPLLRFDGYHMLVDILDIPNLFAKSRNQLKYLAQRYLLRIANANPAAQNLRESLILPAYGIISIGYWIALMVGIVAFIANQYLDLGLLIAIAVVLLTLVLPFGKLIRYLLFDDSLEGERKKVVSISTVVLVISTGLLITIPVDDNIRISGIVKPKSVQKIYSTTSGHVADPLLDNGTQLSANQIILQLENREIFFQKSATQAKRKELLERLQQARAINPHEIEPLNEQLKSVDQYLTMLEKEVLGLTVKSPETGTWTSVETQLSPGQFVVRGEQIGTVTNDTTWEFIGVIPQIETYVFASPIVQATLKLDGQERATLPTTDLEIIPHDNGVLPSPALGIPGGGSIAVNPSDPSGLKATEPFFQIKSKIMTIGDATNPKLIHGGLATLRVELAPQPLASLIYRELSQYLQKYFRI